MTYANPPLAEVVCGVHFQPLRALLSPHYGLLWETFREHGFEKLQEAAPLPPLPRQLEAGEVPVLPQPRIWYVTEQGERLVQIQRDRLLYNWRKTPEVSDYPGFDVVFGEFVAHLKRFQAFLRAFELGDLRPLEFELSYVNHLLPTDVWSEHDELGRVFTDHDWHGPMPLELHWRTTVALRHSPGVQMVTIRAGRRNDDNSPIFLCELSAKGIHDGADLFASVEEWFTGAHTDVKAEFERMLTDATKSSFG